MEENKEDKEIDVVAMLTQRLNELFEDDFYYESAKMEEYLAKVGDMQIIAKNQIEKYKAENNIQGDLTPEQIEEIAIQFDKELKKSIETDKAMKDGDNKENSEINQDDAEIRD